MGDHRRGKKAHVEQLHTPSRATYEKHFAINRIGVYMMRMKKLLKYHRPQG